MGRILCLLIALAMSANGKVTPNSEKAIIFTKLGSAHLTYKQWIICYYFDLKEYQKEIEEFAICIKRIEIICSKIEDVNCIAIAKFLQKEYREMQSDLSRFRQKSKRARRDAPLKFVGTFYHWLTGMIDEDTGKLYENKINELVLAINEHNTLESKQTTIIKKSFMATQKKIDTITENVLNLHNELKTIERETNKQINENTVRNQLNFLIQIATLIIVEHKESTESISKAMNSDFSKLLSIDTLKTDLNKIRENIDNTEELPINLDKHNVYELGKIQGVNYRIGEDVIMLELGIPIVESKTYALYTTTPIPIMVDQEMYGIKTTHKYILANVETAESIELSKSQMDGCAQTKQGVFLCQTNAPVITNNHEQCEAHLLFDQETEAIQGKCKLSKLPRSTYISEIFGTEEFIITPNEKIKMRTVCNKSEAGVTYIETQSKISLDRGCSATIGKFRLRKHDAYRWDKLEYEELHVDLSQLNFDEISKKKRPNPKEDTILLKEQNDYASLIDEVEAQEIDEQNQKTLEQLETASTANKVSTAVLGTVIGIMVIICIYIVTAKVIPMATYIARQASQANGTSNA